MKLKYREFKLNHKIMGNYKLPQRYQYSPKAQSLHEQEYAIKTGNG